MWVCEECGARFDEPDSIRYNIDDYNGVSDLFGNWQYGHYDACPYCGSEEINSYSEDEEGVEIWTD